MKTIVAAALAAAVVAGCQRREAAVRVDPAGMALFSAIPAVMPSAANPVTEAKVSLGRMLYYDTRLSRDGDLSCNSCHDLTAYGVDGHRVSTGFKGQQGGRNAPTVYGAAGHIAQFWDGRAADVEAQAKGPILNPIEMAMPSDSAVLNVIGSIPEYRAAFRQAFPGEANPITYDNLGKAIGAFERQLVTPSRWDRFLQGDSTALTAAEKEGFNTFVAVGCAQCHNGPYVGGLMYRKAGLAVPWPTRADPGRAAVTHNATDSLVFKVPGLRNIAKTGPYFHDGATESLGQAVRLMAHHQLGYVLTDAEVASIVTWLGSLTGTIPAGYVAKPALPGAGS